MICFVIVLIGNVTQHGILYDHMGLYHLEYHMRSAELHVTGFLLEYGFEQGSNAKLGCFLDCRIYSNNNNGEFICTTGAKVLFKNNLLSESKKHQTRSKFACMQVTGEMHGCASLI